MVQISGCAQAGILGLISATVVVSVLIVNQLKGSNSEPDILFLDLRRDDEIISTGFYSGSNIRHIPCESPSKMDKFLELISQDEATFAYVTNFPKPKKNQKIVTFCKVGKRAEIGMNHLKSQGYTDVSFYTGSMNEWH